MQSPIGVPASPSAIYSALTTFDMKFFHSAQANLLTREIWALCQILKDRKNAFICDLVDTSYNSCYTQTIEISNCAGIDNYLIDPNPVGADKVVHLNVVEQQFYVAITAATNEMATNGLELHTFRFHMPSESANVVLPRLFEPLASTITFPKHWWMSLDIGPTVEVYSGKTLNVSSPTAIKVRWNHSYTTVPPKTERLTGKSYVKVPARLEWLRLWGAADNQNRLWFD